MARSKNIAGWKDQVYTMVGSPEFWSHCPDRTQFVKQCYEKICGHTGGDDGVAHWCAHHNNVGHHKMLRDFIEHGSPRLIIRFFEHYRGRTPGPEELNLWSPSFLTGRLAANHLSEF